MLLLFAQWGSSVESLFALREERWKLIPLMLLLVLFIFFCLGTAFPLLLLAAVSKLLTEVLREGGFPLAHSSMEAAHGGRRVSRV